MSAATTCEGIVRALALETSGRVGSLAAFRSERGEVEIVASQTLAADRRSAQTLIPAIHDILAHCQWRADQLELICTTTGPGSFTGLRIGITTAKTLAYATGAKLVGVHTLAAIAAATGAATERVWAILDAQREQLFTAVFPAGWELNALFVPDTKVMDAEDWINQLSPGDVAVGPPLEKLSARLPAVVRIAPPELWHPSAAVVARLAARDYARGKLIDPMQLTPNYFRPSAAEEKAQSASQARH